MRYKALKPDAKINSPKEGDAGYDLFALSYKWNTKGCCYEVSTGVAVEIPKGHVGIIKDRSGQALMSVQTHGGVIDSSYRGEVIVFISTRDSIYSLLHSLVEWAGLSFMPFIKKEVDTTHAFKQYLGKFAQMIVVPCYTKPVDKVNVLSDSERNEKGFGSTGV